MLPPQPPTAEEIRERLRALIVENRESMAALSRRLGRGDRYLSGVLRSTDGATLPARDLEFLDRYFGGELLGVRKPERLPQLRRRRR